MGSGHSPRSRAHFGEIFGDTLRKVLNLLQERPEISDLTKCHRKRSVITILGHVDHGKTTMLDYIRKSSLAKCEHGGITQRIGAFYALIKPNHEVVFLDTPGHYLFGSMRSKAASVTDMSILVIAWEDGVMPQTRESINLLHKAGVPFIVAVNKCDRQITKSGVRKVQYHTMDVHSNIGCCRRGI